MPLRDKRKNRVNRGSRGVEQRWQARRTLILRTCGGKRCDGSGIREGCGFRKLPVVLYQFFGAFRSGKKASVSSVQKRGPSRRCAMQGVFDLGSIPCFVKAAISRQVILLTADGAPGSGGMSCRRPASAPARVLDTRRMRDYAAGRRLQPATTGIGEFGMPGTCA